jgi:phage terminase small subunit
MGDVAELHGLPSPSRRGGAKQTAPAPRHLQSRDARKLWRSTVEAFHVEAHHLAILEQACTCVDRLVAARAEIARRGIVVDDRYGVPKQNPACAIERDARIGLARLLRELQLGDDTDLDSSIRPPRPAV